MADNTTLNPGTGGDLSRAIDKGGVKTQVVTLDLGGAGAESLTSGVVPVSAAALPLPSGAATEATQALQATAVNQATEITALQSLVAGAIIADFSVALREVLLGALNHQIANESSSGRLRVVLDALGGAQTLGTVTTLGTCTVMTNLSNLVAVGPASAGIPIRDALLTTGDRASWALNVRSHIV